MTDGPTLAGLDIADPPERWSALGFAVSEDGRLFGEAVRGTLGIAPPGRGIVGWTLAGLAADGDIDGLATRRVPVEVPHWVAGVGNANAVTHVDHVVVTTPDLDAFAAVLDARGLGLRRRAEVRGAPMGFRRLGRPILEVVEDRDAGATAFWGVTFAVAQPMWLDRLAAENRFVGAPRPAVQPGRRIATVSGEAGLSTRVAFIDPE